MEGFSIFISILAIVWSILSIILFFKVWGMTNDVRTIKELMEKGFSFAPNNVVKEQKKEDSSFVILPKGEENTPLAIGDKVRHIFYNTEMYIKEIYEDETCLCVDEDGNKLDTYKINNLSRI